jgi:hypothetical protein
LVLLPVNYLLKNNKFKLSFSNHLDVLQGRIKLDDAQQIMYNMVQIWQGSNVWYEFLEQLVYILVAVTVPAFAQGAMGKIMAKVSSSK